MDNGKTGRESKPLRIDWKCLQRQAQMRAETVAFRNRLFGKLGLLAVPGKKP